MPEDRFSTRPLHSGVLPEVILPREKLSSDERLLAMFCHLGGLFTSFVVPLIFWIAMWQQSRFVAFHGKEAFRFQVRLALGFIPLAVLTGIGFALAEYWGLLLVCFSLGLMVLLLVHELFACIRAGNAASRGEWFRY